MDKLPKLQAGPAAGEPAFDYCKYHGLGNDYLVIEPERFGEKPPPEAVRAICDRHRGVGSDGILWGPHFGDGGVPAVTIFNPDGSEGEKSGNGLRIFARYLWERGHVTESPFAIQTAAGTVRARVIGNNAVRIAVEMGQVRFDSSAVPVAGPPREVLQEVLSIAGTDYTVSAAGVGNPHCVVEVEDPTPEMARAVGPAIEHHPWFPNRTNVQFMTVLDRHRIRIEIWERGAGYTLASGTSSCAAAAVACRLDRCESPVTVHMPGGELEVRISPGFEAEQEGAVAWVGCGEFSGEFLAGSGLRRV